MGAAFYCIDEVHEAVEAFDVAVVVLNGDLDGGLVLLAGDHDGALEQHFLALVEILDKGRDAARIVVGPYFRLIGTRVLKVDRDVRIEEGQLAQTGLEHVGLEIGGGKNLAVRQELHAGAALVRVAHDFELRDRVAALVALMVFLALAPDREVEPDGERVDDGDADAVQTAGDLIGALVELAARVQDGHYHLGGGLAGFVHLSRDAAAVVHDRDAAVLVDRDVDGVAAAGQRFVYRVVYDFVDQVVQAAFALVADIHAGTFANRFEPLKYVNILRRIFRGGLPCSRRGVGHFHINHLRKTPSDAVTI